MKETSTDHSILRYQTHLLARREEIVRTLRNHRLVNTVVPLELCERAEQRDIDLFRFTAALDALSEIKSALERVADGTFGICEQCGNHMATRRLEALPWARFCVSCQESSENCARDTAPLAQSSSPPKRAAARGSAP
jgi:DnaK suppressor protein